MSKVIIKKMALHYFKGIKNLEVEFNDQETIIKGPNGSGKSTIADAFTWLLWGKNMAGESDTKFLIKTVDEDGNEIPHVDHEVEAELLVDDAEVKIRRVLVPEYNKKDELKGNHTDYYWNDVPLKKTDFDAKIKGIIDETAFKFITSPFAFLNLEWKKQREILLGIAGDIDDEAIAKGNIMFCILLEALKKKNITLEEFKAMVSNQLAMVNDKMKNIPARIDEVQRGIPEIPNFSDLLQEEEEIKEKIASFEKDLGYINRAKDENIRIQEEISRKKAEQSRIVDEEEVKARQEIHLQNVKYDTAKMHLEHLVEENRTRGMEMQSKEDQLRRQIKALQNKASSIAYEMQRMRDEWRRVNATEFVAEAVLICPLFKKACNDSEACMRYESENGEAFEAFCKDKQSKMEIITTKGKALKSQLEDINPEIEKIEITIADLKKEYSESIASTEKKIEAYEKEMKENPRRPLIANVDPSKLPEWAALQKEIEKLTESLTYDGTKVLTDKIDELRKPLYERLAEIQKEKAKKDLVEAADKRIKELEEELRNLGAEKAELEEQRMAANEFEVARMNEVSNKVNGMFKIVTWQMFQRQVNGENIPACVALVNGVRWSDANNAARINAGIDVASTLACASKASAPMFIDNTESVAEVYNPGCQQRILLEFDKKVDHLFVVQA